MKHLLNCSATTTLGLTYWPKSTLHPCWGNCISESVKYSAALSRGPRNLKTKQDSHSLPMFEDIFQSWCRSMSWRHLSLVMMMGLWQGVLLISGNSSRNSYSITTPCSRMRIITTRPHIKHYWVKENPTKLKPVTVFSLFQHLPSSISRPLSSIVTEKLSRKRFSVYLQKKEVGNRSKKTIYGVSVNWFILVGWAN